MRTLTKSIITLSMLLFAGSALAGAESGFYLGASIGSASLDASDNGFDIDDDDNGYKIYGGFNFGVVPLIDLAVEGGYVDFGSFGSGPGDNVDVDAWTGFGLAGFKLGPIGLFGKMGMISWDTDYGIGSDSGTDPAYGLGARFQLGSFALRAEYELFDLDDVEIDYLSVGAAYTF